MGATERDKDREQEGQSDAGTDGARKRAERDEHGAGIQHRSAAEEMNSLDRHFRRRAGIEGQQNEQYPATAADLSR